jgi:DNA-binding NarL/FixJ family response regulator
MSGSARILLVEDEFLIAAAVENDLCDVGHVIVGVSDSADGAVALAKQERPDLVIMDIRLSGPSDGVDAALRIFRETGIRCIFASAHADAHSRTRAAEARPLAWLQKPYGRETLLETVEAARAELLQRS